MIYHRKNDNQLCLYGLSFFHKIAGSHRPKFRFWAQYVALLLEFGGFHIRGIVLTMYLRIRRNHINLPESCRIQYFDRKHLLESDWQTSVEGKSLPCQLKDSLWKSRWNIVYTSLSFCLHFDVRPFASLVFKAIMPAHTL